MMMILLGNYDEVGGDCDDDVEDLLDCDAETGDMMPAAAAHMLLLLLMLMMTLVT